MPRLLNQTGPIQAYVTVIEVTVARPDITDYQLSEPWFPEMWKSSSSTHTLPIKHTKDPSTSFRQSRHGTLEIFTDEPRNTPSPNPQKNSHSRCQAENRWGNAGLTHPAHDHSLLQIVVVVPGRSIRLKLVRLRLIGFGRVWIGVIRSTRPRLRHQGRVLLVEGRLRRQHQTSGHRQGHERGRRRRRRRGGSGSLPGSPGFLGRIVQRQVDVREVGRRVRGGHRHRWGLGGRVAGAVVCLEWLHRWQGLLRLRRCRLVNGSFLSCWPLFKSLLD